MDQFFIIKIKQIQPIIILLVIKLIDLKKKIKIFNKSLISLVTNLKTLISFII